MDKVELSAIERKVLNCIQEDIPLNAKPFKILSNRLGMKEDELLHQIRRLKAKGVIRSYGAGIDHRRLGFKSTLIALKAPSSQLGVITKKVIRFQEVTHCFLREGDYNLWVVFIYKKDSLRRFLNLLNKELGKERILNLPTVRGFKLKTNFKI